MVVDKVVGQNGAGMIRTKWFSEEGTDKTIHPAPIDNIILSSL